MGWADKIFGSGKGQSCQPTADGKMRCRIFKNNDTDKLQTGTDVILVRDENRCKVMIESGDILEEDKDTVEKIRRELESSCKGG